MQTNCRGSFDQSLWPSGILLETDHTYSEVASLPFQNETLKYMCWNLHRLITRLVKTLFSSEKLGEMQLVLVLKKMMQSENERVVAKTIDIFLHVKQTVCALSLKL